MWPLIPEGSYSIVHKPGDADLCIRARVADDIDRLRASHLLTLSVSTETPGGDYRYRAWIIRAGTRGGEHPRPRPEGAAVGAA